ENSRDSSAAAASGASVLRDFLKTTGEQRLRLVMDCGMIGVASWDKERRITAVNDTFIRMAGRPRTDFESARPPGLGEVFGPEFAAQADRAFAQMSARGSCDVFHSNQQRLPVPLLVKGAALDEESGMALAFESNEQKPLQD